MLVMPVHSSSGQNCFVGTGISGCNERLYWRSILPLSLTVNPLFSTTTITMYLCASGPRLCTSESFPDSRRKFMDNRVNSNIASRFGHVKRRNVPFWKLENLSLTELKYYNNTSINVQFYIDFKYDHFEHALSIGKTEKTQPTILISSATTTRTRIIIDRQFRNR